MSVPALALVAFLPILVALILMVGFRMGAAKAMPLAWLTAAAGALFVWGLPIPYIAALSIQGAINAFGVLLIVFGALLILHTLQYSGGMETIQYGMQNVSKDMRVQALIIGALFAAFIEGAAGFGTPAALAAPLLLSLGFPPLAAAILCLVYNSFPVCYGAVGTPIIVGFSSSIKDVVLASGQWATMDAFNMTISQWVSLIQLPMVFIIPLFMLGFITRFFGPSRSWADGFRAWKFSLFVSISFAIPFLLCAWLVGPEFPSLIGGLIALGVVVYGAKRGFCMPKDVWTFGPSSKWDKSWTGNIAFEGKELQSHMSQFQAWLPYVLIGGVLVVTRIGALGLKGWLTSNGVVKFTSILGYENVNESLALLYIPGLIPFTLISILTIFLHKMSGDKVKIAWVETFRKMKNPTIALIAAVALVKIFQGSGVNPEAVQTGAAAMPSMPMAMAQTLADALGGVWSMFAAYVGGLGAFITGSNTVSDMLFGLFQWDMASQVGLPHQLIIALQAVGGAMGNMICIHNIVAACAVVGLANREGDILKQTFWPFLMYGIIAGITATILVNMYPGLY